ncbi:intraflagellar transport-associated protein [Dromiciops gliroides]|uniref:intraflagellar transport-associated protein n=1 Tax=Dromiciops gliroides TaxID=33562 RepID=UPI001CC405E6|nr:intraflagellar transport-associated protein [Dromiciops gliroides]XP_043827519.1 intraflagellar transport-associated protein [Dromiciops gliroides]XP_043827520.1 intraflagellar transport-associated protein [Dromiciops gliroides]XP_043827521.1 intraflagellar transport-associated protein [Dromiciops gliroides]XP_043827522.1 intraflagellar transport-associated protein [Dromiciops gliroides]XP_043827523.1 intraflagellar transport-associated protein [Dromiciops gliroides]
MFVQLLELGNMDEDRLIEQALDQFINRHEQTYEEFLNTFTHLSKDHQVITSRTPGTDSSGASFVQAMFPRAQHIRNEHLSLCSVTQPPEEEQIVIDEGQKVGISIQGDLNRAGKVKVDNFLDLEDFDREEETDHNLSPELWLLPGEVEEEVPFPVSGYIPSLDQHSHPEPKAWPTEQPRRAEQQSDRPLHEVFGDEVQPFSLDEDFDYDGVMLTPKFSSAEMETILEMTSQSRLNPDTEAKEPHC